MIAGLREPPQNSPRGMIPPIRRGTNTRTSACVGVFVFGVRVAAVKGYLTPFRHSEAGSGVNIQPGSRLQSLRKYCAAVPAQCRSQGLRFSMQAVSSPKI